MRVLAAVLPCLLIATAVADARPSRRPAKQQQHPTAKRVAAEAEADRAAGSRQRVAVAKQRPVERSQSVGAPWDGRLQAATRLRIGEGAVIRRPLRAFGTRTTVEYVRRAVRATLASHPKTHALAIGDMSAEHGGWISEHNSHRSGRDVDLGFFFKRKPAAYPTSFVRATDDNLDYAATWALLANVLGSHDEDGGVQVIFLDYDVQGLLYKWAQARGIKARTLDRIFQYPHGRGSAAGIVRHEPNHADHFHVRFRCAKTDAGCY